ncbi:hypothetical protein Rrhod_3687 [Rhodococcus rhodnii LMG 5362]|uniref:Uncharacterized protein n=1 Tax=Rhodococcus rhodnii LMG 5362 TaxID=1273125 RepID=R7WIF7_9NOCA|nr:hypothetical protein Rrhod_3687 [Rhodococcus rhodnii LMG 5362]
MSEKGWESPFFGAHGTENELGAGAWWATDG